MQTVRQILEGLPDGIVRKAASEALEWNQTGILHGDVLRYVADRLMVDAGRDDDGLLRDTDTLICRESARRFVAIGARDSMSTIPFDKLLVELIASIRTDGVEISTRTLAAMMVAEMQLGQTQTPRITGIGVEFVREDGSETFAVVSIAEYALLLKRWDEGDLRGTIKVMGASQHELADDTSWSDGQP